MLKVLPPGRRLVPDSQAGDQLHRRVRKWVVQSHRNHAQSLHRLGKKFKRVLQWCHALKDSTVSQCRVAGSKCPTSIWRSMAALWSLHSSELASRRIWFLRMRACNRCPVYDHRLKRCHNRHQTYSDNGVQRPFGCGCYIPVKAMLKDASCWMERFNNDQWLTFRDL